MVNFLVCSHITENEKEKDEFTQLKSQIEQITGEKINLILPKNYLEEQYIAKSKKIKLYFASPINAYRYYKKGYIPFCKKDHYVFVLVGEKKVKDMTISLPSYENFFISLLFIKEVDLLRANVIYELNEEETYKSVLDGRANLAMLLKEHYNELAKKYKPLPILKEISSNMYHFLMIEPKFYKKHKLKLQKLNCKKTSEKDLINNIKMSFYAEDLLKIKTFFDIAKSIYENEYIGTIIFKEKIIYASKSIEKILGYPLKEIGNLSPVDIFGENINKNEVEKIIERRLKGEHIVKTYPIIKFKSKNGTHKYIKLFTKTIIFDDDYASLGILIDITKEVKYQKVLNLLRRINKAITTVLTEDELFNEICSSLVEEFDIKFTWIAIINPENKKIEKIYKCGIEDNYLKERNIKIGSDIPFLKLNSREIVINPETSTNKNIENNLKNLMLDKRFLSSACIPIEKDGKISAFLNIYALEPGFFEEERKEILKEMQHDINFALKRLQIITNGLLLKSAVEKSNEWVLITDENGKILYINDYVSKISGYEKEEIIGKNPRMFKSGYQPKKFYKQLWDTILSGKEFEGIFVNRKKNGELFYLEEKIIPVKLPDGSLRFVSLGRDITQEVTLSQENEKLKYYDILTGLYNYNGFKLEVEDIIEKNEGHCAIALLDIANFSYINKTYGIRFGDKLLKKIGNLLKSNFRDEDIISRVGGDEFSICFTNIKNKNDILILEHKLKELFKSEIELEDKTIKIYINGGISIYPDDGTDFHVLYENASIALKEAKKDGLNIIKFFNKELENKVNKFIYAGEIIEKASKENLFIFHYQPYFSAGNLKVSGFEALVRIKDKEGHIYYPSHFIDYLETSVYLKDFENWSIKEVINHIKKWKIPISVNISARTFKSEEFVEKIFNCTENLPANLVIEITERLYMGNLEQSSKIIERIKQCKNVKIAIDDFGTGYSSLAYLKDINADILKIDISFVKAMVNDIKAKAVVETIIHLAKALGMKTLAEGVETEIQLKILQDMNVDYVQGFYLSKPLPEEEIEKIFFTKM